MFKPAPNVEGCILNSITALANVIVVDDAAYGQIIAVLGEAGPDHTYIKMGEVPAAEYMQVQQAVSGTLIVNRGVDGTIARAFPELSEFRYILTAQAIQDIVNVSSDPPNISITADAPLEVEQLGTNNFNISLPEPVFQSSGNTVDITGSYPNYDLNVVRGTNGCCD